MIGTNLLTKFHEDPKINVASRVLTRKNAPPPGSHVFQPTGIIFELTQYIIGMNLMTKFHEDRTVNVASRVKNAPPVGSHVFQANIIIFEFVQDITETNLLTKFHEDWTINAASRVKNAPPLVAMKNAPPPWWPYRTINVASRVLTRFYYSNIHVFQAKATIFELIQDIIGTNLLTKFHEDLKINVASRVLTRKNAPPLGGHVFQPAGIILNSSKILLE
ncbi:hypothetical protein DPMN_053058 [Dreissena polymorpha]|uniref:Uncharacterized protein n=1 Tax=Dreissena polymorpha TaxID=45954 RepID=A0A9D4CMK4_DREPO|nr:hypothetical protein DPMN_053058 [Dreissena polymorpha]